MQLFFVLFSLLLFFQPSLAQKLVEKAVINPMTKYVKVDAARCFRLSLSTHKSDLMKVVASMEGEYAKDLVIKIEEDGDNIAISTDFLPSFKNANDKLSALRVISVALEISLPEYMSASVYGTNTNVLAVGQYHNLEVILSDGNCTLQNISESATVKTQSGDIRVIGARGMVTSQSFYGEVLKGPIPEGDSTYELQSVEGKISININNG